MERPIESLDADFACFACSQTNERGLRLRFWELDDGVVECRWTAPAHVCGFETVVHGGIQATLLDETMGYAVNLAAGGGEVNLATVELQVRFRRPCPVGLPIVVRAVVTGRDGRDLTAEAAIHDEAGERLTVGTARWRILDGELSAR
ncbi:MAG: PaaI family thioesterase [Acidimicrobiales bacterium]|jgi:uncharacterized protein (TIGR00369 family)|nr:PaaI family thioesterase [Acidimicrobiales bacterium]